MPVTVTFAQAIANPALPSIHQVHVARDARRIVHVAQRACRAMESEGILARSLEHHRDGGRREDEHRDGRRDSGRRRHRRAYIHCQHRRPGGAPDARVDGQAQAPMPIGSFTALEKQASVVMDSRTIGIPLNDPEGYRLTVADAVRVTWGGVYVHSAPWSVESQGYANVSHGCINLSPDNAAWYYDTVNIGDPIIVKS